MPTLEELMKKKGAAAQATQTVAPVEASKPPPTTVQAPVAGVASSRGGVPAPAKPTQAPPLAMPSLPPVQQQPMLQAPQPKGFAGQGTQENPTIQDMPVPMAKPAQALQVEAQGNKLAKGLVKNAGDEAERPKFDRAAADVARPSNFVGFDAFAGLNADAMASIADRAALATYQLRNQADSALREATAAVTPDMPLEQTPAFKRYRELMAKADQAEGGDESRYAGNLSATGNSYEDSLRELYAPSQRRREAAGQQQLGGAGDWAKSYDAGMKRDEAMAKGEADAASAAAKTAADASKKAGDEARAANAEEQEFLNFVSAYKQKVFGDAGNERELTPQQIADLRRTWSDNPESVAAIYKRGGAAGNQRALNSVPGKWS